MEKDPAVLESEAHSYLAQEKCDHAYKLFSEAAEIYKGKGKHKQAALVFASAASCWAQRSGEKSLYNSAVAYEEAACQAERGHDLEYASMLYKHAAISFEKDGEFLNFSDCFYRSKESYRKFLIHRLLDPRKIYCISKTHEKPGLHGAIHRFFSYFMLTFSYFIWGHGERPARALYCAVSVILASALIYSQGVLAQNGGVFRPGFLDSLYFSAVTFTTVGYGDISPVGVSRYLACAEAFCGMFLMPLFIVSLSRRYLRF
jgi:hypothetical protein